MRIAVLVKQVPAFEEMELGADGRLVREGIELELNPYCRRAVAQSVILAAEHSESRVTVITLGPPGAVDSLREAIAWGLDRDVDISGVLVSDPVFAGSDTLATAKALAAALAREGPFDLVLTGRNSVDADTGQVPAELAELCGLPFLTGVRYLNLDGGTVHARCEHDDGWMQADVELPTVLSCAERLCDPAKVDPPQRALVPADRIRRLTAADIGTGPWGKDASPTVVGRVRTMAVARERRLWVDEPIVTQVANALAVLRERGALVSDIAADTRQSVTGPRTGTPRVFVLVEPDRAHETRELLGAAAQLTGSVTAITVQLADANEFHSWGADEVVHLDGANVEEDVAAAVVAFVREQSPRIVLAGSTAWGREVAARVAAQLDAGLTGDAVELEIEDDFRLIAWKPAFGGQLVAAVTTTSPVQMATVRAGVLPVLAPRSVERAAFRTVALSRRSRVRVLARTRDDDLNVLSEARAVIGVGQGVAPERYGELEPLRALLAAELGATRKVTDKGWLPRSRQIGITGRAIAPRLFVSIGASGKFNHVVGVRAAQTVLAINPDPSALIFQHADAGIVGAFEDVVPAVVDALRAQLVVD